MNICYFKRIWNYLVVLIAILSISCSANKPSCGLTAKYLIKDNTIKVFQNSVFYISIKNTGKDTITLPEYFEVGTKGLSYNEMWYEVAKCKGFFRCELLKGYGNEGSSIQGSPRKYLILKPDSSRIISGYFFGLFTIREPGTYKVKAYIKVPNSQNCGIIETKWAKFNVIN